MTQSQWTHHPQKINSIHLDDKKHGGMHPALETKMKTPNEETIRS